MDPVAVFEKAQKDAETNAMDSEYAKINKSMRSDAEERLDEDLQKRHPEKYAAISQQLPNLKDAILEDMVRNEQFIAQMMSNKDVPEEVKNRALKKFEEGSDAEYDFNIAFLDQYARIKNLPEYKSMNDTEKHEAALKLAYDGLNPNQRKSWQQKESVVNALNYESTNKKFHSEDSGWLKTLWHGANIL